MSRGAFVVFEDPENLHVEAIVGKIVETLFNKLLPGTGRADQRPPIPNERPPIWELVIACVEVTYERSTARDELIADMRMRHEIGVKRYGTPLQAHNGRDALRDAYEEALDGVAYSRQACEESGADTNHGRALHIVYQDFLELAYRIRGIIDRRAK